MIPERRQELSQPKCSFVFQIAKKDGNAHGDRAGLLLVLDVAILPSVEFRRMLLLGGKRRQIAALRKFFDRQRLGSVATDKLQLLIVESAKLRFAEGLPEEAQSRRVAILAVAVLVKEALHGAGNNINIFCGNELVQQMPDLRLRAEPAGNIDTKPLLPVSQMSYESKIVELGIGAICGRV